MSARARAQPWFGRGAELLTSLQVRIDLLEAEGRIWQRGQLLETSWVAPMLPLTLRELVEMWTFEPLYSWQREVIAAVDRARGRDQTRVIVVGTPRRQRLENFMNGRDFVVLQRAAAIDTATILSRVDEIMAPLVQRTADMLRRRGLLPPAPPELSVDQHPAKPSRVPKQLQHVPGRKRR